MKSKFYGALGMLAATMVLALPMLNAQSRIVANVPFNFYVGEKAMAAGTYQVQPGSSSMDLLQNLDTDAAVFVIKAIRVQDANQRYPKLVFERCGNQYFLSQIWDGASDTGIQLPRSRREKEILMANHGPSDSTEIIVLAMNRE
jgi:hypothetical protein